MKTIQKAIFFLTILSLFLVSCKRIKSQESKEVKKELKQNYFAAQVSMDKLVTAYSNSGEAKPSDLKALNRLAQQFTDVTLYSVKKLVDNKLKFELKLNSSKGDKNIILQTLDMIEELSTK